MFVCLLCCVCLLLTVCLQIEDTTISPLPNKYSSTPLATPTDRVQRRRGLRYRHMPHTPDSSRGPTPNTTTSPGTSPASNNSAPKITSNGNSSQEVRKQKIKCVCVCDLTCALVYLHACPIVCMCRESP